MFRRFSNTPNAVRVSATARVDTASNEMRLSQYQRRPIARMVASIAALAPQRRPPNLLATMNTIPGRNSSSKRRSMHDGWAVLVLVARPLLRSGDGRRGYACTIPRCRLRVERTRILGAPQRSITELFDPVALRVSGIHAFIRRIAVVGLQVLGHVIDSVLQRDHLRQWRCNF